MAGIKFDITGDNTNFLRRLKEAEAGVKNTSRQIEQSGTSIEQMFERIQKAATYTFVGFSAKEFISSVAQVRGEFQQLEVAFKTMLGNTEDANALMNQLINTAAITPFDLQGVANGAKQLLAYGDSVENVNDDLIRLGNIAAGLSQPLGDIVYLYGTTMTQGRLYTQDLNQFTGRGIPMIRELAKQFGVAENEVKSLVEAGKVGFPEVQKVIMSLTNEGGMFYNLMQEQSKTITGQISNIEDAFSTMLNDIGKANEGIINEALSSVSYLIENYEAVGREIMSIIAAYGAYKAVVMSVAAYQNVTANVTYSAEIAELSKLIPLKQQSANEDINSAVASGKLSQAKAEQIIAMRSEVQARLASLQSAKAQADAEMASATVSYKAALQRQVVARQNLAIAQSQMKIAMQTGTVEEIEVARKNAQNAALEVNNAALAKNTAHKSMNAAASSRKAAAEALDTFQISANTAAQNANITSTNLLTIARTKLAAASKALGLSMLANPAVLVAASIAALTYGVYKLATAETSAEKAVRKHREEQERFQKSVDERKSKIDGLLRTIQDETETEYEQVKAYEQLKLLSPALTEAYTREQLATASLTETNKKLNEEKEKANYNELINSVNKWKTASDIANKATARTMDEIDELYKILGKSKGSYIDKMFIADMLKQSNDALNEYIRVKDKAKEEAKPVEVRLFEAKNDRDQIVQEFAAAKLLLKKEQEKIKNSPFGIIPIDVQIRFNNAQEQLKNIDSTISKLQSQQETSSITYQEAYKNAQVDYKAKLKALQDAKKGTEAEYKKAKKELEDSEKKYKDLGGVTGSSLDKQRKEAEKKKELQEKLSDELLSLIRQNQQDEINLMEEGAEKKLKQIDLDYGRQIDEIKKKEKEWAEAQGGKLTEDQTSQISVAYSQADEKREKDISSITKEKMDAERQTMNEYLKEYGEYMQKRQAITEMYNEKIAKATTEGERLSLGEQMKKDLAGVDDEAQKKTSVITKLFDDMSKKTVADMREIAQEAKNMLSYINSGEYKTGEDGSGLFGLTKEQFDILSKSPEKLESIKNEIANVEREADESETALNKVAIGLKDIFSSGGDSNKLMQGLKVLKEGLDEIYKSTSTLLNSLSSIGNSFGSNFLSGIGEGISQTMNVMNSAISGAQAGMMFGPIGSAAGAALGVVSSLSSAIAGIHDKKNEKRIQRLQERVETLDRTYDKLGKSIEKSYSNDASDLIEDQNTLLQQQKVLIQQQIKEEQGKKKSDKGRIKEWQQQIEDINDLIEENKEKAKDAIFGEDLQSAIEDFADAYASAWDSGEDRAKSAKDVVKNMIKNMINESIKAAASDPMKEIREKLLEFWSDEYISGWEQDYLNKMATDLQKELDDKFGWADSIMGSSSSYSQQATGKGFEAMSQDVGMELNGRFTALQIAGEEIKNQMILAVIGINSIASISTESNSTLNNILSQHVLTNSHLEDLVKHAKTIIGFGAKLDKIVEQTK